MLRTMLLAACLGLCAPTHADTQAADPDLALSQLSWDVVAAMPDRAGCLGVSPEFDTAIAGLLDDARLLQVKAWFTHTGLQPPPRSPTADPVWDAQRCLDAVHAVFKLLDDNDETLKRMAQAMQSAG